MTPWEEEQEKQEAEIWGHYRRKFIFDKPFYTHLPPEPVVNFDLGYKQ